MMRFTFCFKSVIVILCFYVIVPRSYAKNVDTLWIDKGQGCRLLAISPNQKYVIYSKDIEGTEDLSRLYLFDIAKESNSIFSKDSFDIRTLSVEFHKLKDETFFFSAGEIIFYVSIVPEIEVKPLFKVEKHSETVRNLSLSSTGRYLGGLIVDKTTSVLLLDLHDDRYKIIDNLVPDSDASMEWSADGKHIYMLSASNSLMRYNLETGSVIDLGISPLEVFLLPNRDMAYYVRNDSLIALDLSIGASFMILSSKDLSLNFVYELADSSLLISFNNNVLLYSQGLGEASIIYTSTSGGRIVRATENLFFEENAKTQSLKIIKR